MPVDLCTSWWWFASWFLWAISLAMFVWHHGQSLDAVDTWRKGIKKKDVRHQCALSKPGSVFLQATSRPLCWQLIWFMMFDLKMSCLAGPLLYCMVHLQALKAAICGKIGVYMEFALGGFSQQKRVNPNAAGSSSKRVLWKPASLSIFQFQQSLGRGALLFLYRRGVDKDVQPRQVCSFWSFTSATACFLMDMWTWWHFQIFVAPKFWADFLGKMEAPSSISFFLLVMLLPGRCLYKLDAGQLRNGRKFPSAMLVETWKSCLCWRNLCQINFTVRLKLLKSKLKHYIYINPSYPHIADCTGI